MYKNVVFKGLGAVLVPPGTDPHIPHSGLPHPPMIWTLSSIQFFSILTAQIPNLWPGAPTVWNLNDASYGDQPD